MKILLSGATGMLGRALLEEFAADEVVALPPSSQLNLCQPLAPGAIPLGKDAGAPFDLVVHAAGCSDPLGNPEVNEKGTRNFLHALGGLPARPGALCYISCTSVYAPDSENDITEDATPAPESAVGRSKLRGEEECRLWSEASGVALSVLRPGMIFGPGVGGEAHRMFLDVIGGRYIHVRGSEGRLCVVMARDVARAVRLTAEQSGVYNVSDGSAPTWLELAEAMSANAGAAKRMITLPPKWADWCRRFGGKIPAVATSLSDEVRARRAQRHVVSTLRLRTDCPDWAPSQVTAVLRRTDPDYPYQD